MSVSRSDESLLDSAGMSSGRKSSQSWYLPTEERRELYVAAHLPGARELVIAHLAAGGVDYDSLGVAYRDRLETGLRMMIAGSFDAGAKHEAFLRETVHTQKVAIHQLEALLRVHGIPVPSARIDSKPPHSRG